MPQRYQPRRLVTRWDRAAVRLPSRMMTLLWSVVGTGWVIASATDLPVHRISDGLPPLWQAAIGALMTVGAVLVIIGILWDPENARRRRAVERSGWGELALAWGAYASALALAGGGFGAVALAGIQAVTCVYVIRHLLAADARDEGAQSAQ